MRRYTKDCNETALPPICAKQNKCYDMPCLFGATCLTADCFSTYECLCAAGYTGDK